MHHLLHHARSHPPKPVVAADHSSNSIPSEVVPELQTTLTRFVFDQIPVRLINVSDMGLVDRFAVIRYFRSEMGNITAEVITKRCEEKPSARRDQVITEMVKERVRYAIFSHRWLDDGEPTYQDMMKKPRPVGPGYQKLQSFCQKANSYGVQFAWSDTCCIDKTSSSELDESIRSMFRWYRNSFICIAYLAGTDSVTSMHTDVWFTRGWTLQEVLAPKSIKFYGSGWRALTDAKDDLDHTGVLEAIQKTTTIRARFLRYRQFEPGPKDIAKRMTWAAKRTTTRGEDRAYSLMGIFGVSLSTAYGEGPDQAFFRLVEAIIQVSNNPDILNWAGEHSATSHSTRMLPSSPECYLNHPKMISLNSPQSFMLTNRGLRLTLLIIRAVLSSTTHKESHHAIFEPDRRLVQEKELSVEGISESVNKGWSCAYAFGMWNIEDGLDGQYLAPPKFLGCLMTRVLPNPWKRIPTRGFITLTPSPSLLSKPLNNILEIVYL